jgi:hypothetical protein
VLIRHRFALALLPILLATGCGSSTHIQAKGRIIKGGQAYRTNSGEGLRIIFAPLEVPRDGRYDSYAAVYEPSDGTFRVKGKDGEGLPPGKYRVSLELMKNREDMFGGKLVGKKSPFTVTVTRGGDDLVIDLDKAPLEPAAGGTP